MFGICGGSGAGKTTLTKRLTERLDKRGVSVLAFDAYYRDRSHLPFAERRRGNYDHPDSLDRDLFLQHLDALKQGIDVDVPVYDFATHTLTGRLRAGRSCSPATGGGHPAAGVRGSVWSDSTTRSSWTFPKKCGSSAGSIGT